MDIWTAFTTIITGGTFGAALVYFAPEASAKLSLRRKKKLEAIAAASTDEAIKEALAVANSK